MNPKSIERLLRTTGVRNYGSHTAEYLGDINNPQNTKIVLWLFSTIVCIVYPNLHTYEIRNGGWVTASTTRAIRQYIAYLDAHGYRMFSLSISNGYGGEKLRALSAAQKKGMSLMQNLKTDIVCHHTGMTGKPLKSLEDDTAYVYFPDLPGLTHISPACVMCGHTIKKIVEAVTSGLGPELEIYSAVDDDLFSTAEPTFLNTLPILIWEHAGEYYAFRFEVSCVQVMDRTPKWARITYHANEVIQLPHRAKIKINMLGGISSIKTLPYHTVEQLTQMRERLSNYGEVKIR